MKPLSFLVVAFLAFLLGALALWMAREQWESYEHDVEHGGYWDGGDAVETAGLLSLEEIVRRLELPAKSRILEVERELESGRMYYEIEFLLPDGRIEEVMVDPRTAEVVKREREEGED